MACAGAELTGGTGKLYIGGRPGEILIIDEATEKVTGQIQAKTGTPNSLSLSDDHKRFYFANTMYEDIEVADIATRQVIDTFRLSEGNKKVRIRTHEADPTNSYMILLTKTATKMQDHWEIGPSTLLQYDLKAHKVMRTIPVAEGRRARVCQHQILPRREADVYVRRGHPDLRYEGFQGGR